MTSPLETYLSEIRDIRATGANQPETSFYAPLSNLLNEVGSSLKPKVRCVMQLANRGAGLPDGGLFTSDQANALDLEKPLGGQVPSRGVIEAKPVKSHDHEVAWLDRLVGSSLTFADPATDQAWVRVESMIPDLAPAHRPSIKIYRRRHPEGFDRMRNSFEWMWGKAEKK